MEKTRTQVVQKQLLNIRKSFWKRLDIRKVEWLNDYFIIFLSVLSLSILSIIVKHVYLLGSLSSRYIPVWLIQEYTEFQLMLLEYYWILGVIPVALFIGTVIFTSLGYRYSKLLSRMMFLGLLVSLVFWLVGVFNIKHIATL